jgi:hypothetical protein
LRDVLGLRTLLVAAVVGFAATGLSACGTGESVATHAPRTTLTAAQSTQLVSDERAWTTAQKRWVEIADHCLRAITAKATMACRPVVTSFYLRWHVMFARATSDVHADAATLGGSSGPTVHTCKSRLFHYLGGGRGSVALVDYMHEAEVSAVKDGLNFMALIPAATKTMVSAARAAEAACTP